MRYPPSPSEEIGSKGALAFDLDHTIVKPAGSRRFPKDENDWKYAFPTVRKRLRKIADAGYLIVFFSNSSGRFDEVATAHRTQNIISSIFDEDTLAENVVVYIASEKFRERRSDDAPQAALVPRKPFITMVHMFNVSFDTLIRMYCGDAMGRENDFSDTDYRFAWNISKYQYSIYGDDSYRKEENTGETRCIPIASDVFFETAFSVLFEDGVDSLHRFAARQPKSVKKNLKMLKKYSVTTTQKGNVVDGEDSDYEDLVPSSGKKKEIFILRGLPGCGKTTLAEKLADRYSPAVVINRDTLKTKKKCEKALDAALEGGSRIVWDNTSLGLIDLLSIVKKAKSHGYAITIVKFQNPVEWCYHHSQERAYHEYFVSNSAGVIPPVTKVPLVAYRKALKMMKEWDESLDKYTVDYTVMTRNYDPKPYLYEPFK